MSAIVSAASVPGRRRSTSASMIPPMNDLRESPTRIGAPNRRKRSRFQMQAWFCSRVLPKPTPGSSRIRPKGTPAPAARLSERSKKRSTSSRMSIAASFSSRLCMMTTAEPVSATASAMPGSRCRPQTSLMTQAPSRAASRATLALLVSMEIGASSSASASSAGTTRRSSSSSGTGRWPGLVDSPPISTIAAPSATIVFARATAAASSAWRPPSENESGVTLRMPMSWGDVFSALRNLSRWMKRRSMPMSVGYRVSTTSATASRTPAPRRARVDIAALAFIT